MKKIITLVLMSVAFNAFAQNNKPKSIINDSFLKKLHSTQMIFDGGYITGDIKNTTTQGGTFSFGVVINDFWYAGLNFDFFNSRSIRVDSFPVVNPRYSYSSYTINNEFIIGGNYFITASLPVQFGVGYANYYDKYSDNNQRKSIADDVFFVAEGGATVYINFLKNVSLGGGVKYRWVTDVQQVGENEDFNNYSFEAKVRFRFFTESEKVKTTKGTDL